jgi:plasmid stabilization system protein ParE
MKYHVQLVQRASDDLREYFRYSAQHAPLTASVWLSRFQTALESLSENPSRCGLAPENELVDETIYQFIFGKVVGRFRVLFIIQDNQVIVLNIRRGTMRRASIGEFFG